MEKAVCRATLVVTLSFYAALGVSVRGWSQVVNASLTGSATDPSGAVVPKASVTATQTSTNLEQKTTTDSAGYYLFPALLVGTYTVTVEATGFKKAVHDNIVLGVGQRARSDFSLEVGPVTQAVEVRASAVALQTEDASPSTVIGNNLVLDVPTGQRNWDDLMLLVPGVGGDRYTEQNGSTMSGRTGGVTVNGVRTLQNNFILDGIDNNTISENVQELSTEVVHESLDAIDEFKMITDPYSTEYGRSPGAAVIVATKSGSNKLHGTGWEFVRNDKFDATDFFTNLAGSTKPEYRLNQFGGNVGGPIKKDRAFFFFNYEGTRRVQGSPILTSIPTAGERNGDFSSAAAAASGTDLFLDLRSRGRLRRKRPRRLQRQRELREQPDSVHLPRPGSPTAHQLISAPSISLPPPPRMTPTIGFKHRFCSTTTIRSQAGWIGNPRPTNASSSVTIGRIITDITRVPLRARRGAMAHPPTAFTYYRHSRPLLAMTGS